MKAEAVGGYWVEDKVLASASKYLPDSLSTRAPTDAELAFWNEIQRLRRAIDKATTLYLRTPKGEDAGAKMFEVLMDGAGGEKDGMLRPASEER